MSIDRIEKKRPKVAWGITGSGDRLVQTVQVMKDIKQKYQNKVDVRVFLSKAGDQVIKYYHLVRELQEIFQSSVEVNPNSPFLAGQLQQKKFKFLLIAPATSNTTAKISLGIADTMLCNAAIMGLKAFIPIYIMPSDYQEGIITTDLPNGRQMTLRIRKEDVEHVRRLATMDDVFLLKDPSELYDVFQQHFGSTHP